MRERKFLGVVHSRLLKAMKSLHYNFIGKIFRSLKYSCFKCSNRILTNIFSHKKILFSLYSFAHFTVAFTVYAYTPLLSAFLDTCAKAALTRWSVCTCHSTCRLQRYRTGVHGGIHVELGQEFLEGYMQR